MSYIPTLDQLIITIEAEKASQIAELTDRLASCGDADDLIDDTLCEIKGHYGSKAANEATDANAEDAIAEVEAWITENVSNGTVEKRVAACLTLYSFDELIAIWCLDLPVAA